MRFVKKEVENILGDCFVVKAFILVVIVLLDL